MPGLYLVYNNHLASLGEIRMKIGCKIAGLLPIFAKKMVKNGVQCTGSKR
jgi:hypothetical protein